VSLCINASVYKHKYTNSSALGIVLTNIMKIKDSTVS